MTVNGTITPVWIPVVPSKFILIERREAPDALATVVGTLIYALKALILTLYEIHFKII